MTTLTKAIRLEIAHALSGQSDAERRATEAAEEIAGIVADIQALREQRTMTVEQAQLALEASQDAMRGSLVARARMDEAAAEATLAVIGKLAVKAIGAVV